MSNAQRFGIVEATIGDIHAAYRSGALTARSLVQMYLNRIDAYDRNGPAINSVIALNPKALNEADALDAAFKSSGPVGPLHGIPVLLKDQIDLEGMPTTLGSVLFKGFTPKRNGFVVSQLKKAGVIFLGKVTLGELGGRHAWLAVRVDAQCLRPGTHRGWFLRWLRRQRVSKFLHRVDRSGRFRLDT